ncbi:MAG: ATP-binding cassette domain-containing protein, partial [Chloroflexi bacterium]
MPTSETEVLVQCERLVAGYGSGGDILRGVDLEVDTGDFVCLIGPNGAGKSTLLRTISGLIRPRRGRILFRGKDIGGRRPDLLFRDGIAHVPQGRSTFPQMTVWENVLMGAHSLRDQQLARRGLARATELFPIV